MLTTLRSLATLLCGCLAAQGVLADTTTLPIKTGLWQVTSESEINGKKVPDAGDRLANLPPEARAKMEAMLKERGIAMDSGGGIKICHTSQTLESGVLQGDQDFPCKTEFSSRTTKVWKWHSECSQPVPTVTDGETDFESPESYTIKRQSTLQRAGQSQTVRATIKAKWLGADCGDVKPLQLQQPPVTKKR